jgi:hypothetical protein
MHSGSRSVFAVPGEVRGRPDLSRFPPVSFVSILPTRGGYNRHNTRT